MKATLVIIEWEDSRQPSGNWVHLSDFEPEGISECVSVGFLVYDGDDYKALAANMADVESEKNMQASGIINIPARCIIRIRPLEETTA